MEKLTNQQIILLTLLVSFVTSIATGIVTITLMQQAPPAVTHLINQVVEKVVPTEHVVERVREVKSVSGPSTEERIVSVVDQSSPALVILAKISDEATTSEQTGFIISADGYMVTAGVLDGTYTVILADEKEMQAKVVSIDKDNGFSILKISHPVASSLQKIADSVIGAGLYPIVASGDTTLKLGQTVIALGHGYLGNSVGVGIVTQNGRVASSTDTHIFSDMMAGFDTYGAPLLDISGNLAGLVISGRDVDQHVLALPISYIRVALKKLVSAVEADSSTATISTKIDNQN